MRITPPTLHHILLSLLLLLHLIALLFHLDRSPKRPNQSPNPRFKPMNFRFVCFKEIEASFLEMVLFQFSDAIVCYIDLVIRPIGVCISFTTYKVLLSCLIGTVDYSSTCDIIS
ncbi:hypothetical protein MJO28_004699, partial [Puccinia striiformis f. sp. tritici]